MRILQSLFVSFLRGTRCPGVIFCIFLFFCAPALLAQTSERATSDSGQDPEIFEISTAGLPAGEILLLGSGFEPEPEDNSVYVLDGESGAFLEVLEATPEQLRCRIKPYDSVVLGAVQLRTGSGFMLPAAMHHIEDRTYLVDEAWWFVGQQAAAGPILKLLEPSGEFVIGSQLEELKLHIYLSQLPPPPHTELEIRLIIEADPTRPEVEQDEPQVLSIAASLRVTILPTLLQKTGEETLAEDLALILNETYGSLGLHAEADGGDLFLCVLDGIFGGFGQVSY